MKATIFDIKRFAVNDGDGIRTTVFFKGCPLKCVWCHNPEGISFEAQPAFWKSKCLHCGECVNICTENVHRIEKDVHIFEYKKCVSCGKCEHACLGDALKIYGSVVTVSELLPLLLADRDFYDNSGGGVTLSGGECLCQADFCAQLLKALKDYGVHTAVDTCGFVPKEAFDKVLPYTDVFLYDIKAIDEAVHIKCTGQSNKLILENLKYIDSLNKKTEIRFPFVKDYNDSQISQIMQFLKTLNNVTKVKVLPYHNYAGSKYEALDINNTLPAVLASDEEIKNAQELLSIIIK